MLKNSQGAGREGLFLLVKRTKGPEGMTFSAAEAQEREGTDFMPFVDVGKRENFFHGIRKATSGEGGDEPTGPRERRLGFCRSPS